MQKSSIKVSYKLMLFFYSIFDGFSCKLIFQDQPVDDTQVRTFELNPLKTYEFYADKQDLPYELYNTKKNGVEPKVTYTVDIFVI